MFWKQVVSLSYKTPTFEVRFSGHGLTGQKKVLKTRGFSIFFCHSILELSSGPPEWPQKVKTSIFLSKTIHFYKKIVKSRYFSLLFGGLARSGKCLDIVTDRLGFRFFVFQKRPLKNNGRLNLRPFWTAFGSSPFQKWSQSIPCRSPAWCLWLAILKAVAAALPQPRQTRISHIYISARRCAAQGC